MQLSVCLWWHDYRRDDFPTLKSGVVIADLLAICRGVIVILFLKRVGPTRSRPPEGQLWAGDAVGGAPQRGSVFEGYKAPGLARADCWFCPTTGRPLQRRKAKAKATSCAARSASRRGCRSPRGTATVASDARGLEKPEHLAALPLLRRARVSLRRMHSGRPVPPRLCRQVRRRCRRRARDGLD